LKKVSLLFQIANNRKYIEFWESFISTTENTEKRRSIQNKLYIFFLCALCVKKMYHEVHKVDTKATKKIKHLYFK